MSHSHAVRQNEGDGVVLVWSAQNLLDRPEYTFTCQSQVLCVEASKFSPHLLLGGTYSGQVVLWDMRAKSTPVQRSPLSPKCHTHPVSSLQVVGTLNAHNLVSASTDGRLCSWSLDNLLEPLESMDLRNLSSRTSSA